MEAELFLSEPDYESNEDKDNDKSDDGDVDNTEEENEPGVFSPEQLMCHRSVKLAICGLGIELPSPQAVAGNRGSGICGPCPRSLNLQYNAVNARILLSSSLVDNVIAESRRARSAARASAAPLVLPPVDVNDRKTSLEIVPISKISNTRGADQKYKLNCNRKAIMYRAKSLNNHVMPRGLPLNSWNLESFADWELNYHLHKRSWKSRFRNMRTLPKVTKPTIQCSECKNSALMFVRRDPKKVDDEEGQNESLHHFDIK
ncbi:hypothetical protein J6590_054318 [Homalodisca vitripennis]|nr:hypothetical protein J6590_054318 [Homalodisca vitripennis]